MKTLSILFIATSLLIAGCGGSEKTATPSGPDTSATSPVKNEASGTVEQTITVTGNSMADMGYDPMSFSVKSGAKVKITLVNTNSAEGMIHNWVLVKLGTGQEVATAAIQAGDAKNYIPDNPNVLAGSALAKPNQTVSFEFIAPEAGVYNYICTYPGHFPKMIGKLIVG